MLLLDTADLDLSSEAKFRDPGKPAVKDLRSTGVKPHTHGYSSLTVAHMLEIVSRHIYAPTAATAGLSWFHHQTHVVPNHTPVMITTTVIEAMNAHGESPPARKRPSKKKRLREGCNS